jgi:hypothetical protein
VANLIDLDSVEELVVVVVAADQRPQGQGHVGVGKLAAAGDYLAGILVYVADIVVRFWKVLTTTVAPS